MSELKSYSVWDASTRWFHWINALCVIALAIVGFLILNAGKLEVSNTGKLTLKTVHTWIGYIFVLNLVWRIAWAFLATDTPGGARSFPAAGDTSTRYAAISQLSSPATPNNIWVTTQRDAWV